MSYALDLFGANRHLVEGLKAERDYEAWQLEGARLMLAGNVVASAIRQAQLRKQIELTQQLLSLEEQELKISEQRYSAGGIAESRLEQPTRDCGRDPGHASTRSSSNGTR